MTEFRTQHKENGKDVRPLVSLVMNFTKPTPDKPSLLTFDEVTTFCMNSDTPSTACCPRIPINQQPGPMYIGILWNFPPN